MDLPSGKEIFLYYWWVTLTIFGFLLIYLSCTNDISFTQSGYVFLLGLGVSMIGISHWASMYTHSNGGYSFNYGIVRGAIAILGGCATVASLFLIVKDIFS